MEKNSNDLSNLCNLPIEIQQEIASYLDAPSLGFFAQSHKQTLKNILPLLVKHQARFPLLRLAAKGESTYFYHTNQLFACGSNSYGQLGLDNKMDQSIFTAMPWSAKRGKIQQVSAGSAHVIVLTEDNRLWVRGDNYFGQLGLGNRKSDLRLTFTTVPWPIDRGKIQQVIAAERNTIVLTQDNKLWVCGYNDSGQLGLGDKVDRAAFTPVKILSKAMQQVYILNQLIKFGLNESDSQQLLKKPGCSLQ